MTPKTTRPKFLLLDANIVIEAYILGIWQPLIERVEVLIPSIVIKDEALFFRKEENGVPPAIRLEELVEREEIKEISASADDIADLHSVFDRVFVQGLHDGESEALAWLLKRGGEQGLFFCTSDAHAIQALAMLGRSRQGISMEELLKSIGLEKPLSRQFTEEFFKSSLERGQRNRISGTGLAKD
jgi:hypothetical protein